MGSGNLLIFSAVTRAGDPVAAISLKYKPLFRNSLEIGSLSVNPAYQGYRIGESMTRHAVSEAEKLGTGLLYASVVTFNPVAIGIFEGLGFSPTGLLPAYADREKHMGQLGLLSRKHSFAIYLKKTGPCIDAPPRVYVPSCISKIIEGLYGNLGISPVIVGSIGEVPATSGFDLIDDDYHKTTHVYLWECGSDLHREMEALEQGRKHPIRTIIVYLNVNSPAANAGYGTLKDMGYRFFGLMPLCGQNEFVVMAKTSAPVDYSEIKATACLASVLEKMELYG